MKSICRHCWQFIIALLSVGFQSIPLNSWAAEICHDGWCWENPGPQGNGLTDLWTFSANDIWAVGDSGTILHWNGAQWSRTESNTKNNLTAVWGSTPNNLWAVGQFQILLHWNGTAWSTITESTLSSFRDIWGLGANDIWVTNAQGGMLHFDGTSWTQVNGPIIQNLSGRAGEILGYSYSAPTPGLYRYNGASWSAIPNSAAAFSFNAMWANSSTDIWIVGDNGKVARWNGTSWTNMPTGRTGRLYAVWGTTPSSVWAAGQSGEMLYWNGTSWSFPPINDDPDYISNNFKALGGNAANDVWTVGPSGLMRHWDGVKWHSSLGFRAGVLDFWGSDATHIWGAVDRGALFWNGVSWVRQYFGSGTMAAIYGFSSNDVWAAGQLGETAHWNGSQWTTFPSISGGDFTTLWGSSTNDLWGAGLLYQNLVHWNGSSWSTGSTERASSIWGAASDKIWAVGGDPRWQTAQILYYNGSQWATQWSGTTVLYGVWGSSASNVWAVGLDQTNNSGVMLHYNGSAWSPVSIPAVKGLKRIWGSGASDVWVVGDGGTALYFNGSLWSKIETGTNQPLYGIWGSGSTLRIAGGGGTILRRNLGATPPVISVSAPPNGYIDPLEDRDASTGLLLGTKNISITFSTSVANSAGGTIGTSNFQVRCVKNGSLTTDLQTGLAPSVTQVTGSGAGPYSITLSQRICLGAWTEIKGVNIVDEGGITLSTSNDRILLGALPMDVTQDGKVLGDDISRWLAVNNNSYNPAPLTKVLLLDQKRNGVIAGEDISRAIQLINGIATFRAWSGFDLGAAP